MYGIGIGIGSDDWGTGFGNAGRVVAATAAEPHELATMGGALPIGDDGGALGRGGALGAFARVLAAVGTGALNSTGS